MSSLRRGGLKMKHRDRFAAFVVVLAAFALGSGALPIVGGAAARLAAAAPTGHFKLFRVPTAGSEPRHITDGPDGNLWFTESNSNVSQIGRIDAAGNVT